MPFGVQLQIEKSHATVSVRAVTFVVHFSLLPFSFIRLAESSRLRYLYNFVKSQSSPSPSNFSNSTPAWSSIAQVRTCVICGGTWPSDPVLILPCSGPKSAVTFTCDGTTPLESIPTSLQRFARAFSTCSCPLLCSTRRRLHPPRQCRRPMPSSPPLLLVRNQPPSSPAVALTRCCSGHLRRCSGYCCCFCNSFVFKTQKQEAFWSCSTQYGCQAHRARLRRTRRPDCDHACVPWQGYNDHACVPWQGYNVNILADDARVRCAVRPESLQFAPRACCSPRELAVRPESLQCAVRPESLQFAPRACSSPRELAVHLRFGGETRNGVFLYCCAAYIKFSLSVIFASLLWPKTSLSCNKASFEGRRCSVQP